MLVLFLCAVTGTLKGYDQLLNLVLDGAVEFVRGVSFLPLSSFFYVPAQHGMRRLSHVGIHVQPQFL